jgi:colicin import membrane protein
MEVARTEGSLVASLCELRAIEDQRLADERAAVEAAAQARRREREAAERTAREAEAATVAAERAAQLAAEQARADAERETRLRIEATEAAERARQLVALDQQRLVAEMALRREVAMRQRPRWMIAVTGLAVVAACAMAWVAYDRQREGVAAAASRDRAIAERILASEQAQHDRVERDDLARQLAELAPKITDAIERGRAAQDDADRRVAQDRLVRLQRHQAALAEATRRRDEERRRQERNRPVVIPAACLTAAVCK